MSGATTAIAIGGAAAVGAAASASAADKASSSADAATAAQERASAAQLSFSKEQYEDWKSVFGDVQDNLSAYYKNLTPESFSAASTQAIQQQYAQASKQLDQSLAQRGIATSGLQAQVRTDMSMQQAKDIATAQVQAPLQVAQAKQNFLALGLNQGANAVSSVNQAYNTQANMYGNQANTYNAQAAQASAGVGSSLGSGINSYLSYNAMQNQSALINQLALQNQSSALGMSTFGYGGGLTGAGA